MSMELYCPYPEGMTSQQRPSGVSRSFRRFFASFFRIFHEIVKAVSWVYILIPFIGWNKAARLGYAYLTVVGFLVLLGLSVFSVLTGYQPNLGY